MIGKSLEARVIVTFTTMMVLAMCLQSTVFVFLGTRASIRNEIAWAQHTLQTLASEITYVGDDDGKKLGLINLGFEHLQKNQNIFSCLKVELAEDSETISASCRFHGELSEKSKLAKTTDAPATGFAGTSWKSLFVGSEVAILAVPIRNRAGEVVGSISAERSLLPLNAQYEQEIWISIVYLIVNASIFGILAFFRMERILFKPLDKLVKKAEDYRLEQPIFLVNNEASAFRKLSSNLNAFLNRIESDNRKLRLTVSELEKVNSELKEKNDLVVRSEKLASVGRLSAGLAHEIGNPLSIIQGYVELLGRDDLGNEEKRQFSEKVQQELDRIKRLIKQLLNFAGPVRSQAEPLSVSTLIKEVIDFVSLEKSCAGCKIATKLLAEQDQISDKDGLRQVLINCLLNAADATAEMVEKDKREIVVSTHNETINPAGPVLVICIQDNGVGIEEAHLQYIFDPFFTTKEVGRGTGLGLFVCHTIMERLGGTITIGNRAPAGTEVKIEIPLLRPSLAHAPR